MDDKTKELELAAATYREVQALLTAAAEREKRLSDERKESLIDSDALDKCMGLVKGRMHDLLLGTATAADVESPLIAYAIYRLQAAGLVLKFDPLDRDRAPRPVNELPLNGKQATSKQGEFTFMITREVRGAQAGHFRVTYMDRTAPGARAVEIQVLNALSLNDAVTALINVYKSTVQPSPSPELLTATFDDDKGQPLSAWWDALAAKEQLKRLTSAGIHVRQSSPGQLTGGRCVLTKEHGASDALEDPFTLEESPLTGPPGFDLTYGSEAGRWHASLGDAIDEVLCRPLREAMRRLAAAGLAFTVGDGTVSDAFSIIGNVKDNLVDTFSIRRTDAGYSYQRGSTAGNTPDLLAAVDAVIGAGQRQPPDPVRVHAPVPEGPPAPTGWTAPDSGDPTWADLEDPAFNAIWSAIKGWDIGRPGRAGYAGATGTDAMAILHALRAVKVLVHRTRPGAGPAPEVAAAQAHDIVRGLGYREEL